MGIREKINGRFDEAELTKLTWPIAWSGRVPESEVREEEASIRQLVGEAREEMRNAPDAVAVDIRSGEVVAVLFE